METIQNGTHTCTCGEKLEVKKLHLGFGMPNLYRCPNGHWWEGGERRYTSVKQYRVLPLRKIASERIPQIEKEMEIWESD